MIHNAFDFESALNTGGRYTLVNDITIHDLSKSTGCEVTNTYFEDCFGVNSWICDDEGGAIFSMDSTLDLSSFVFKRCHAADGGAVFILDGSSKITNCSFIECRADSSSYGGAIYVKGTTFITDCNFTKCYAEKCNENYWGGAIDSSSSSIHVLDRCIIIK